jgi:hypothetical protein
VTTSGIASTFVTGVSSPEGLAFDGAGNLFASDFLTGTVDEITPGGSISTFATGFGFPDRGLVFGPPSGTPEPFTLGLGIAGIALAARRVRAKTKTANATFELASGDSR